jgi:hypothetical protein
LRLAGGHGGGRGGGGVGGSAGGGGGGEGARPWLSSDEDGFLREAAPAALPARSGRQGPALSEQARAPIPPPEAQRRNGGHLGRASSAGDVSAAAAPASETAALHTSAHQQPREGAATLGPIERVRTAPLGVADPEPGGEPGWRRPRRMPGRTSAYQQAVRAPVPPQRIGCALRAARPSAAAAPDLTVSSDCPPRSDCLLR